MKILQILPSINTGGGEIFCVNLSNELLKNNHEVVICVLDSIDKKSNLLKMLDPGVKIVSLNKESSYSIKTLFNLLSFVKKERPDIIHTHLRALAYSALVVLLKKIPVIHTIHNLAHMEAGVGLKAHLYKAFFNIFSVIPVSISHQTLGSTQELYGSNHSKLIYNGVPKSRVTSELLRVKHEINGFKKTKKSRVIINAGRMCQQKNQLLLIDAVNELNEEGFDIVLLIIGSDKSDLDYSTRCLNRVEGDNIKFLGLKSNVADYMNEACLLCLSSAYEGLPLVLLENMSLGKASVSTPAGGCIDVIENSLNGFISKGFEKTDLKFALIKGLESEFESQKIIDIFNNNYSMRVCCKNYEELFTDTVTSRDKSYV